MEKARFELFGVEGSFEGFTNGDHWNGWECPRFTLEEGLRLVDAWNAPVQDCGRGPAVYDSENDIFEFTIEGETDRFGPEVVDGVKLCPIGAYGWCWEAYELQPHAARPSGSTSRRRWTAIALTRSGGTLFPIRAHRAR